MGYMRRRGIIASQPHLVTASGETLGVNIAEPKLNKLAVTFSPVQTGSGTPSPSNVRPIYGWTEIPTQMCGKNLIPPTIYRLANSKGAIVEGDSYRSLIAVVNGGATYTISRNAVSGNRFRVYATREYPASGVPSVSVSSSGDNDLQKTITVPDGYSYLLVYLSNSGDDITSTIQLELGSTATAYEPYRGITPSISLGGTYYGGTVDLVSGTMTVTHAVYSLTGEESGWYTYSVGGENCRHSVPLDNIPMTFFRSSSLQASNAKSSHFIVGSQFQSMPLGNFTIGDYIQFNDPYGNQWGTYTAFKSWLAEQKTAGTPVQIYGLLATPQTVTLTPQTIAALRGQQTVTSPAGSVEIGYWTQGDKYITTNWNQLAKPTESGYWQPYNSSKISVTFSGGVATVTNIQGGAGDGQTIRQTDGNGFPRATGDLFYIGLMVNPTFDTYFSAELSGAADRLNPVTAPANVWTRYSGITPPSSDRDRAEAFMYMPEFKSNNGPSAGQTEQIKCPVIVNLTQMYGAGNEPTAEEFERQCTINGIDLSNPIPYNTGTTRSWRIK